MMHSLLLIMTLLTYNSCQSSKGNIDLVSGGSSKYVIILPDEATKHETKAAALLQDYIKRLSGASLPIITEKAFKDQPGVFIGNTEYTSSLYPEKLKGEGFLIATGKQDIYIKGGTGKGILYGVYTLLENYFGCRKYADIPVFIPVSKQLQLPQQLRDRQMPAFLYRETYYPAAFNDEYLEWHKLHRFEDLWGLWGHSFFKILPPKTYFAAHPDYYALVNGKRQASQLCLSNEGVYTFMVDYFRKAIADNPDAMYWSIAPEDGGGFCTCDQCSKANAAEGGPQGTLIRFINRIAAAFPAQQFTTLAYQYTAHPPLKTKPAGNVYIMLSSIDAYRQEPLSSISSAAAFRRDLEGWSAVTEHIFLWDYTTQFTNYLAPFPDYNNQQANLQYLAAHKVQGVFSQGSGDTYSDMAAYNSYLQAKLLWNPGLTTEEITSDFLNGYYGKAGPFVAQYLQALTNTLHITKTQLDIYGNPVNNYKNYLSPEAIDQYSSLLDKAEKAVEGNDSLLARVYNTRLPLEYTVLQQSRFFGTEKFGYLIPEGNGFTVNPRWPERVKKFVAQCKLAGVKELSEGGGSPATYQQEWDQIFSRKWINSLAFRGKVSLVNSWAEDYPAKKEQTLTDGLQGDKDFSINWLFIYGKDLIATVDLGTEQTVKEIQLNFLQDARHYIFNPTDIIVETSVDGANFTPAGKQQTSPLATEEYDAKINTYRFSLPAVKARYIRVTGKCLQTIPAWRDAPAAKKAAICCDEIYVL
ncbi:DUF4838 domain-containing protein [Chitinophaga pinensis]|nr:DUF4838 domain-containing protein [Chitinophaga pinensis]